MAGLTVRSASYPTPRRSATPGRNPSMTASASVARGQDLGHAVFTLQVDDDAAFAGVEHGEQLGKDAHRVTAGRLNFDDVSPHLDQQLRGIGHRPPDAEIEDAHTLQESSAHGYFPPASGHQAKLTGEAS